MEVIFVVVAAEVMLTGVVAVAGFGGCEGAGEGDAVLVRGATAGFRMGVVVDAVKTVAVGADTGAGVGITAVDGRVVDAAWGTRFSMVIADEVNEVGVAGVTIAAAGSTWGVSTVDTTAGAGMARVVAAGAVVDSNAGMAAAMVTGASCAGSIVVVETGAVSGDG